jgi:multidrug efflux system membrane fusion protein
MKTLYRLILLLTFSISSITYAADFEAVIDLSPKHKLSLPVSGVIKTLKVTAGQRVNEGDEMLALDPIPFKAAKTYAQSRVTVQQTILTESKRDLEQQKELYDRTVLAMVDLENAELKVKRDKAILENAKAQLAEAEYALSCSKLTAPFDAIVLSVDVNQGQAINNALQSKTVITLVKQNYYQAQFYVSADELEKFTVNQVVTVSSRGKQYAGKISAIAYQAESGDKGKDKPFMVSAAVRVQDRSLKMGAAARVSVD